MADQFAMPNYLELEATRRNGIPAVRRKMVHNTTSQNEYRPGELCYIPIDTGANGAFMDTNTTRLKMTVVVRNKNYLTDFINLPRCGWHAIIQEFGIEVNNTLHELNRHYAECIELDMIKRGENKHPFKMSMSNTYKLAGGNAGQLHINFVKPSMVTHMGLPHNVKYQVFKDGITSDTISESLLLYSNPFATSSFGLLNSITAASDVDIHYSDVKFRPSSIPMAASYYDDRIKMERGMFNFFTMKDTVGGSDNNSNTIGNAPTADDDYNRSNDANANDESLPVGISNMIANGSQIGPDLYLSEKSVKKSNLQRIVGGPTIKDLGTFSKCYSIADGANVFSATSGQSVSSFSPGSWPAKQPVDLPLLKKEYEEQCRWINSANVFDYYANTQNIPIGIPVDLSEDSTGKTTVWGPLAKSLPTMSSEFGQETYFHISLKVYSSLIGVLAKKWFPELVVPQGRMRIRLRFQEPNVLFQTLSDPCRRVPGTPRDWFPNLGITSTIFKTYKDSPNGPAENETIQLQIKDLLQVHPSKIISSVHPIMISNFTEQAECFNDAIAMGQYVIPQMKFLMTSPLMKTFQISNYDAYLSNTMTNTPGMSIDPMHSDTLSSGNLLRFKNYFTYLASTTATAHEQLYQIASIFPKLIFNLEKNSTYGNTPVIYKRYDDNGKPIKNTTTGTTVLECERNRVGTDVDWCFKLKIEDLQNYNVPTDFHTFCNPGAENSRDIDSATVGVATMYDSGTTFKWHTDPYWDWEEKGQCWNPFCTPTPQYLPMTYSSLKKSAKTRTIETTDFADENQSYFGTHLEKSEAQVRRSAGFLYPLALPDTYSYGAYERLTYIVRDVQLETEQIILPRQAALSIVENALNGGINMETTTWKEMESILPQAKTQKHLINMAAAYCTSISFLFRPQSVYTTDLAYGYDSFSFYNPFSYFSFTKPPSATSEASYNYLGGDPVYMSALTFQERLGINLQLQLSSELVPRFPIQTISDLLLNTRWGDQVFDDSDYLDLAPRLQPSYQVVKGQSINTLQDGFWASYVPISALDDQSITCNPFFTAAEISLRSRLRGKRAGGGALPFYKPFKGTFHLSFNLEAYMGQSDRIRTGVPIVNNNMFLIFDLGYLLEKEITQLLTVAVCDAKVVFERGGTMQFFT
jgi:hypothetical protein